MTVVKTTALAPDTEARPVRALVFSSTFPSKVHPIHGVFVKERIRHVAALPDCQVEVVSPVPYFPPLRMFQRWYPLSQYGRIEVIDGMTVHRPRYFLLPKFGKYFHARSMARSARATLRAIQEQADFDLIDAHFVYPDGAAAMYLARQCGKPLVITGRGEDVLTSSKDPALRDEICEALRSANQLIAVSDEIAEAMARLGADEKKIAVVPNGVDTERFGGLDRNASRRALNLPQDRRIIISVGYLLERKGYHLLVDALAELRKQNPDLLLLIVGGVARWGQDYTAQIRARIAAHGLEDHVRMTGALPPEELPQWYAAADLFALLTSREGCPNALLEALASGLPAVATPIGQIPAVLADRDLGIVLPDRSAASAVHGIETALRRDWDRLLIRRRMERRSWRATARQVGDVFTRVVRNAPSSRS